MTVKQFVRWCVTDRHGTVVITERPNLPIMAGTLAAILTVVIPGTGRIVFGLATFGALFTWAWLEIFSGSTPLRRVMGGAFLVILLILSTLLLTALA